MVGHDHVQAASGGGGDLAITGGPTVDRDDDRGAACLGGVQRRVGQAVTVVEAAWDVRDRVQAEPSERDGHDRQTGQPIGIKVSEDLDPLASIAGAS